ncbi:MAG: sugar phosphate nucleotidyltransferase [Ginsengibacter sp.]
MSSSINIDPLNRNPVTEIKEAIVLAGGLGTRLRPVVSDVPKCLAPVAGIPFLSYVISHFRNEGIMRFIFSTGYKSSMIGEYLLTSNLNYSISKETEPLGTGGAILLATRLVSTKDVLIINGDTLFAIDVKMIAKVHNQHSADCTLALKQMENFNRYGVVEQAADHSVNSFKEKQFYTTGLINGGVYALNVKNFLDENLPEKFSFERDYLEKKVNVDGERKIFSVVQDKYFIDVGIPEDYERAQKELNINN